MNFKHFKKLACSLISKESRERGIFICTISLTLSALIFPMWTYTLMSRDIRERNRPSVGIDDFNFRIHKSSPPYISYELKAKNYGSIPASNLWVYTRLKTLERYPDGPTMFYKSEWAQILWSHQSLMPGQELTKYSRFSAAILGDEPVDVRDLKQGGMVPDETGGSLFRGFLFITKDRFESFPREGNTIAISNINPPPFIPEKTYGLELYWRYLTPDKDRAYHGRMTFDIPEGDKFSENHPLVGGTID